MDSLADYDPLWLITPEGPYVVHPGICQCGCYCGLGCRCNGDTCNCEACDVYEKYGWMEYTDEQKKRLAVCNCDICKKAAPHAHKRFISSTSTPTST